MKRCKSKKRTLEQQWAFKRHFQNKGIIYNFKTQIRMLLQDNRIKKNSIRATLTANEFDIFCSIQDKLDQLIKNYSANTDNLKGV